MVRQANTKQEANDKQNGHVKVGNKNKLKSGKMKVRVQLTIDHLEILNATELEDGCPLMVTIGWVGSKRKMRYLGKNAKQNRTSLKPILADRVVNWSEEFDYAIKLKRIKPEGYKSRFLYLKVQEGKNDSRLKSIIAPTAEIDITKDLVMGSKRTIRVQVDCRIRGKITTVILEVAVLITERQVELMKSRFSFKRATSSLLFSCSGVHSCVPSIHNAEQLRGRRFSSASLEDFTPRPRNQATECSSSEGEPEPSYKNLKLCNILIDQFEFKTEEDDDDYHKISMYRSELSQSPDVSPHRKQEQNQDPIKRFLSRVTSGKNDEQPRGIPLLNKSCSDIGGDDIDIKRHKESDTSYISGNPRSSKVHPEEKLRISGFSEDEPFAVGKWERRSIFSRDGELELTTDIFLATIDQRSEKASGGSACTVLAVVIADWLHRDPHNLPLRCQLDQLVREGSSIWRQLCEKENHRERFSDQHFDLETVLKEKITPLREVVSYVGFLGMDELQEDAGCLEGKSSFDSIWDQILCDGTEMAYQVYICSWNDHFFVMKIERDAIYLIDTFGERLFEGCNQAYMLKFDKDSVIYRHDTKMAKGGEGVVKSSRVSGNCNAEENKEAGTCEETKACKEEDMENQKIKHYLAKEATGNGSKTCSNEQIEIKEVICKGRESCREYIKGFLASLAVKELKMEMRKGSVREHRTIYERLQIDLHYVPPPPTTTNCTAYHGLD